VNKNPNNSISAKLQSLILSTLFIALVTMFSSTAVNDVLTYQATLSDNLITLAAAVGANAAPAVEERNIALANRVLVAFSAEKSITLAQIVLADGRLFAQYSVDAVPHGDSSGIEQWRDGYSTDGDGRSGRATVHLGFVEVVVPLRIHNHHVGLIVLHSSLSRLYGQLFWQLLLTTFEFAAAIAMSLAVATRLKRRIERPIAELSDGMTRVSRQQDYSLRVNKSDDDEIGVLIDGFNTMLEQIRLRDDRLEQYRIEILRQNEQLQHLATRDSLTGCLNRRAFFNAVGSAFADVKARRRPMAFVMVDIDHFKAVNDSFGHPVGDEVIQAVARTLAQQIRPQDLLCRYGGEEFCVFLPDIDGDQAYTVAERLRASIESNVGRSIRSMQGISVSASLGVALMKADTSSSTMMLIEQADEALYVAKRSGRNRVSVYAQPNIVACAIEHGGADVRTEESAHVNGTQ